MVSIIHFSINMESLYLEPQLQRFRRVRQLLQLRLPTRYAGMQLVSPSHMLPFARTARLIEIGPALRSAVASWDAPRFRPIEALKYDGVDQALAEGLPMMLAARGISGIGGGGRPVAADQPQATDPFRPAVPDKHLLSQYLEHSSASAFFFLYQRGDASQRGYSAPVDLLQVHPLRVY